MMIKVDNLYKIYSYKRQEKIAVDKISFQIDDCEIVGFLGPNGAGKTTTLKMLSGIMFPTDGQAEVLGYVPWEGKNEFKRNISIVLGQKNQLWWDLPANESLYLNKCIYDISDKDYNKTLDELSELLEVKELLDVQVRNLSLGERMKMELLAALLHKPKVIFLDEPTIGLDMIAQKNIRDFLKYYNKQEKITIMLTSHYLEDIEALCQRTIVINNGSLVYDGKIESINEKLMGKKIIKLQTLDSIKPSDDWKIRKTDNGTYSLEVSREKTKTVISYLLNAYNIRDFSVEDIPLEESLEILYRAR
jgi:ABC-2 type transport system ATP-binding protein